MSPYTYTVCRGSPYSMRERICAMSALTDRLAALLATDEAERGDFLPELVDLAGTDSAAFDELAGNHESKVAELEAANEALLKQIDRLAAHNAALAAAVPSGDPEGDEPDGDEPGDDDDNDPLDALFGDDE